MGLFSFLNGKKKEKTQPEPEEKDPNKLSDPGKPTADTVELVSVIAIDDPFLITKEGAFVLMFEIPEIDMDIYGQTEAELCERYQMTLGALPPGTKFQLTVFEEPFDPSDDIRYFTERSEAFQQEIAYMDPTSLPYRIFSFLRHIHVPAILVLTLLCHNSTLSSSLSQKVNIFMNRSI